MKKLIFILIALISFSQAQTIQYIGAPTTTVISRGNFRADSIFYLPKRTKTPTDTAAFRYQISDSSLYYWTGYQWTKVQSASSFASVDTLVISTRAYRQKGDDSLGAIIATKGNGTVTSVATGYGLSGGTITTTGTLIADTALVASRLRLGKVADSLSLVKQNVLTNPVTGTGTTNRMAKFTGTSTVGDGSILDQSSSLRATITSGGSLYFKGASSATDAEFILENDNTASYFFGSASGSVNKDLRFYFNGTASGERFRIFNNGRIFMGSTPTDNGYQVDINGTLRTNNNTFLATSAAEVYINTTTDAGAYTLQNNGALYNTGSAILAATSGSVGIGTTSPARKLDVVGGHIKVDDGFSYMWGAASTSINGSSASNFIDFYTNSTAKARINSAGNFGVGTVNPVQKFVVSNGGAEGLEIIPDGIASTNLIQSYNRSTSAYNAIVMRASDYNIQIGTTAAYYINASQESLFGTLTDAGNYRVQVSGNAYVSGSIVGGNTTNAGGSDAISLWGQNSSFLRNTTDAFAHSLDFYKSRGSAASPTDVSSGDGSIQFRSVFYSGGYKYLNALSVEVDGTFTSGQNPPQRIRFWTNAANGSTTERLRITSDGIVAINNNSPSASAQLDVSSTTRGFLPPRMTTTQRDAISSPAAGLVIYNTTTSKLQVYTTSWTDLH